MARRTARRLGDGSIFYDRKRHRWVAMVTQPTTTEGKRRWLRRTFQTRGEADNRYCIRYAALSRPPSGQQAVPADRPGTHAIPWRGRKLPVMYNFRSSLFEEPEIRSPSTLLSRSTGGAPIRTW